MITTDLTTGEYKVLRSIAFNEFGDGPGTDIWADCINGSKYPSGIEGKALSGVVASLAKKGFIRCEGTGRDATIRIVRISNELLEGMARS
jgi:hypothetical protein